MSNFLLEVYSEDIPSSAQILAEKEIYNLFKELFTKKGITYSSIETFSTPRRITISVINLSKADATKVIEIRGPTTSADSKAIEGFAKSNEIKDLKKLYKKLVNNKEYYFYSKKNKQKKIRDIVNEEIPNILSSIKWQKSMRWSDNNEKWSRPIKSILCILDKKRLDFNFAGLKPNVFTYGNYHYSKSKIKCLDIDSYKKILQKNFVTLTQEKRRMKILSELQKFCSKNSLDHEFSKIQLIKIANSVEHINVFFGSFDVKNFNLPDFIIETIITEKQDNFCFKKKTGELSNFFAFVSNKNKSKKNRLIEGNQNVLKARFSDANFFIEEDLKISLSDRLKKLSKMVFYDNLGNLYQRALRIVDLVETTSKYLDLNIEKFKKDLIYSNFDLTTEIVKEYPSLQGLAGGFYAKLNGFSDEIVKAFSNQYKISYVGHKIDLSVALSISQKVDSVFGFFATQKKISGSGDPFGIRRLTLSLIKIAIEKDLDIDFYLLIIKCKDIYKSQKISNFEDIAVIQTFFNKRIEVFLIEKGYNQEIIRCAINQKIFNPKLTLTKTQNLTKFLSSDEGDFFLKAFKRLNSIVEKVEEINTIDTSLFEKKEERQLYESVDYFKSKNKSIISKVDRDSFKKISHNINIFLDNVMVNAENEKVRKNRKSLLAECKKALNSNFNFSIFGN